MRIRNCTKSRICFCNIDDDDEEDDDDDVKKIHPDVLAEPISTHSYDRVWVYSSIGFESARLWGYRCLTALCALPLSCLCGGLFALLACITVSCHRCVMPCIQVFHICLPCVRSLWMSVVNIFIAPFCTSVALFIKKKLTNKPLCPHWMLQILVCNGF
uniref:Caveolin n=1 Tax=Sinocyclocheilus grahami TaxID=75366 RepID=A0A672N314_SINGR